MSSSIYGSNDLPVFSDDSDAEEARLDALFGAAEEAPTRKKRSGDEVNENPQTDLTADESLQAEAEAAAKAKKKRAKFEIEGPKGLLGPNGLVALHRGLDVSTLYKGRGHEKEFTKAFTSGLRNWATNLFGGMHWEDLLMRIETVGGKDEVKAQLNLMREGVRKEALTKKYGDEGADKILRALGEEASEEARRQLQIDESGENISSARQAQLAAIMARAAASDSVATSSSTPPSPLKSPHPDTTTSTITPATATRTSARLLESDDDDDELVVEDTSQVEETEATFDEDDDDEGASLPPSSSSEPSQPQTQAPTDNTQTSQEPSQLQTQQPDDDDEEEEAEFDM